MRMRDAYGRVLAMCLGMFLGVTPIQAQDDDHGNDSEHTTNVGLNSSTPGELNYPSDRDFFRIEVPHYGRVTVEMRNATELRYENPTNAQGAFIVFNLEDVIGERESCYVGRSAANLPPYNAESFDVKPGICIISVSASIITNTGPFLSPATYTLHVRFTAEQSRQPNDPATPDVAGTLTSGIRWRRPMTSGLCSAGPTGRKPSFRPLSPGARMMWTCTSSQWSPPSPFPLRKGIWLEKDGSGDLLLLTETTGCPMRCLIPRGRRSAPPHFPPCVVFPQGSST